MRFSIAWSATSSAGAPANAPPRPANFSKRRRTRAVAVVALGLAILTVCLLGLIYARRPPATVLMYHAVVEDADATEPSIDTTLFGRQMEFIASGGYETVWVRDVVARLTAEASVPSRWVALTFDGGYADFYTSAYPVLRRLGLKATLFVIVDAVGAPGGLSWDQLHEIHASGLVEVGSHSWDHVADACLSVDEARREKARSKSVLETRLGVPVVTYAYPYGAFSERARRLLREEGYRGAVGTVYRWGEFADDDVFNLRRVYVSRWSRFPLMFPFMLSGYYVPARSLVLRALNVKTPREIGC